ncbi:unnamed protein product [Rangifer tarandus platyrhynchus]|uniref:Uncharacterized protein n=1 Tax=Rangifer tarandus platyrhynchus TaxID=3082113 RepID=A0ABN8Z9H8_RANTA|nr:unnamed protein product [Rangifer tarandus platyrhynchus]CAI9688911.1 unnamed protein product [Rangifer tarandus platyrhynchus]
MGEMYLHWARGLPARRRLLAGRGRACAAPAAASAAPAPARVPGRLIRPGCPPRAAASRSRPEVMAAVPAVLGPVPQSWPPFSGREPALLA